MTTTLEMQLLNEICELRMILERIEALLEERLIGIENCLSDEIEAIREYELAKEKGEVELVRLEDMLKETR